VRPFVVGIAGGTASGKTTLALRVAARLDAALLTHDRYYRDATPETNFDHPDALETTRLVTDLDRLRAGEPVDVPIYDFPTHRRTLVTERMEPRPFVVVEGILVLSEPALRSRFDLAVFVDAPADLRLIRRIRRDMVERGRTLESVLAQYLGTVRPMHDRFVQPAAVYAALTLDGSGRIDDEVDRLLTILPR
jgi:uridine kinase